MGQPQSTRTCSIDGCAKPHEARGWCRTHYGRWQKHGHVDSTRTPLDERFWSKVAFPPSDGCWIWTAQLGHAGYGKFNARSHAVAGGSDLAHRISYTMLVGPIPEGLVIDHLCRNPPCVNPSHMEVVTHRVNILRGIGPAASRARQTYCIRGHLFDEPNTYITAFGHRMCRACARIRDHIRRPARNG